MGGEAQAMLSHGCGLVRTKSRRQPGAKVQATPGRVGAGGIARAARGLPCFESTALPKT